MTTGSMGPFKGAIFLPDMWVRITAKSHELGCLLVKVKTKPNYYSVERLNSTSRSTRERNDCILLARKIKARIAEGGEILCDPGWCVHKFDVQFKWDDSAHTY